MANKSSNLPTFPNAFCGHYGSQEAPIFLIGKLTWSNMGGARGLLKADDGFSTYRFPIFGNGPIKCVACEVEYTGRKPVVHGDATWVRAKITFVGDCEPDQTARGWVRVPWGFSF